MDLRITYKKSGINATRKVKEALKTLGLRKLNQSVVRTKNPSLDGQLRVVNHLVTVEEIA